MAEGEAGEGAAGVAVPGRGHCAAHAGQEGHAVGADGAALCLLVHEVIVGLSEDDVLVPAGGAAGYEAGVLDQPQAGVGGVVGLNKALLVEHGLCGGAGNGLGGAGDIAHHAGLYKAGAEAGAVLVAGAADDLGLGGQAQTVGNRLGDGAYDSLCLADGAQQARVKVEHLRHLGGPGLFGDVVDHGGGGLGIVDDCSAGHPVNHVAVNVQQVLCLFKDIGTVFLYPQHLGRGMGGVEVQAGYLEHAGGIDDLCDLGGLGLCAAVEPDDAVHEGFAVFVGCDDGVVDRVKADGADLLGLYAALRDQLLDNAGEGMQVILNGLLCPEGIGVYGFMGAGRFSNDLALRINEKALE